MITIVNNSIDYTVMQTPKVRRAAGREVDLTAISAYGMISGGCTHVPGRMKAMKREAE